MRAGNSFEHIAPDALGCPSDFVLTQGVCASCNNKNGLLDQALLRPFEIVTVMKGIPRKKGRKPTVDGFSSFASGYDKNGPVFYINREKHQVLTPSGRLLKGTTADDPIKNARFEPQPDGTVQISYDQELRFDRKAVRGLFKIAIEAIAFFEGLDAARDPALEAVKQFVQKGAGNFRVTLMADQNPSYESYFAPCCIKEGYERVCGMTILGIGFLCDFDPEFAGGRMLLAESAKLGIPAQVIPNWPKSLWNENNRSSQ